MKMDPKLVAADEVGTISVKYDVPIEVVRETMLEIGEGGKSARSRGKIYAALRAKDYDVNPKKGGRKKKETPKPPQDDNWKKDDERLKGNFNK